MGSGMAGIIALSFALTLLAKSAVAEETTVDLELVLAVDVSFSMDQREQEHLAKAPRQSTLSPRCRLGYGL